MAATTFEQLSEAERARIEAEVNAYLRSRDNTDRMIRQRAGESFAYYVATVIQATAAAFGYIIALPLAYAEMIVERFVDGFKEGWRAAFDEVRGTRNS